MEVVKSTLLEYDYVRLVWPDVCGTVRGVSVPSRAVHKFLEPTGLEIFSGTVVLGPRSEVTHIKQVDESGFPNCRIIFDPESLREVPWATSGKYKVAQLIGGSYWKHDETTAVPQGACPRNLVQQQLKELKSLGYKLFSSFEMEFKMFETTASKPIYQDPQFCNMICFSQRERLLYDISENLHKASIEIDKIHTEYSAGQFEIPTSPTYGIKAADDVFLLKSGVKEMCLQEGYEARFMTRCDVNGCGNGTHFNHSLWNAEGKNAFYDANSQDKLSEVAKHWLAGILKHAGALAALCCPTVNCYRRFGIAFSPKLINWGVDDRRCMVRAKNISPSATYLENRLPSGSCNPYIAMAATVAAGLDGVRNKLACPPPDPQGEPLPKTLTESLKMLESDDVIVQALGKEFVEWFTASRKQVDLSILKLSDVTTNEGQEQNILKEIELYGAYL